MVSLDVKRGRMDRGPLVMYREGAAPYSEACLPDAHQACTGSVLGARRPREQYMVR